MSCKYSLEKPAVKNFLLLKHIKVSRECFSWGFLAYSVAFCSRQKIELPLMENVQTIPPPYVVRTVLIYSRHAGQLQFSPSEAVSVSTAELRRLSLCLCFSFYTSAFYWDLVLTVYFVFLCPVTENAAVAIFFLRRGLFTQWSRRAGGRDQLEGEWRSWWWRIICVCCKLTSSFVWYMLLLPAWILIYLQNRLKSLWHSFNKVLETFV